MKLNNLLPNTTYYFRCGNDNHGWTIEKQFRNPGNSTYHNFIVGGDIGVTSDANILMEHAASLSPEFFVIGGDIAYTNGLCSCYDRWDNWFTLLEKKMITPEGNMIPIIPTIGNHDSGGFFRSISEINDYFYYFPNMSTRYGETFHSHSIGNMHIIILDSNQVYSSNSNEQLHFLASELKNDSSYYQFVAYHVPIYPSSVSEYNAFLHKKLRDDWEPIFSDKNVDIAFEFHAHSYKRTKPIFHGELAKNKGVIYIGDGCMGADPKQEPVQAQTPMFYIEKESITPHFLQVIVTEKTITVESRNVKNLIFDNITVTKH